MQRHYDRLDALGVDYGFESVPVRFVSTTRPEGFVDVGFEAGGRGLDIWFGKGVFDPDSANAIRHESGGFLALIDGEHTLSARAFRKGEPWGPTFTRTFHLGRATGRTVELASPFHASYDGGGANGLTDSRIGTTAFRDGIWQGFWGPDLDARIDLGASAEIDTVLCGFLQYNNAWIFLPQTMRVYGGNSPDELELLGVAKPVRKPRERGEFAETLTVAFPPRSVRYLRVVAENLGVCPEWHEAAGADAWIFADEIVVR